MSKNVRKGTIRVYAGGIDDAGNYPFVEVDVTEETVVSCDDGTWWIGKHGDPSAECMTIRWEYTTPVEALVKKYSQKVN